MIKTLLRTAAKQVLVALADNPEPLRLKVTASAHDFPLLVKAISAAEVQKVLDTARSETVVLSVAVGERHVELVRLLPEWFE